MAQAGAGRQLALPWALGIKVKAPLSTAPCTLCLLQQAMDALTSPAPWETTLKDESVTPGNSGHRGVKVQGLSEDVEWAYAAADSCPPAQTPASRIAGAGHPTAGPARTEAD